MSLPQTYVPLVWPDPLAQTFLVTIRGGVFVTKLDLFFAQKDDLLPVWVEIRNVVNGYPVSNFYLLVEK